jgi:hypothetical protein
LSKISKGGLGQHSMYLASDALTHTVHKSDHLIVFKYFMKYHSVMIPPWSNSRIYFLFAMQFSLPAFN